MKEFHIREQLSAYLDKALAPYEIKFVERHLHECSECQEVLNELKHMVDWMKTLPKPVPRAGLETRMMGRLKAGQPKKNRKFSWVPLSGGLATAMVAGLVFVMIHENRLDRQVPASQLDEKESLMRKDASSSMNLPVPVEKKLQEVDNVARLESSPKLADQSGLRGFAASPGVAGSVSKNEFKALRAIEPRAPAPKPASLVNNAELKKNGLGESTIARKAVQGEESFGDSRLKSEKTDAGIVGLKGKAAGGFARLEEWRGSFCEIKKPEQLVVRTREEWESLLQRMGSQAASDARVSSPDFSWQMVVAVFMGEQPSAGYGVQIVSEELQTSEPSPPLIVKVRKTSPLQSVTTASVLTQPYHLKIIPAFPGMVEFQDVK